MVEHRPGSSTSDPDEIAGLQAQADAGDCDAAGRLGELLAWRGDREDALRVWVRAYGDRWSTTRQLAELWTERGDLDGAVRTWQFSDPVYCNPRGRHPEYLSTLPLEERLDGYDPEEWGFIEAEELARLLAELDGKPRGPVP